MKGRNGAVLGLATLIVGLIAAAAGQVQEQQKGYEGRTLIDRSKADQEIRNKILEHVDLDFEKAPPGGRAEVSQASDQRSRR
jgi:hypothetical protein